MITIENTNNEASDYTELKTKVDILHRFMDADLTDRYMDKETICKIFGWDGVPEAYECNEN